MRTRLLNLGIGGEATLLFFDYGDAFEMLRGIPTGDSLLYLLRITYVNSLTPKLTDEPQQQHVHTRTTTKSYLVNLGIGGEAMFIL